MPITARPENATHVLYGEPTHPPKRHIPMQRHIPMPGRLLGPTATFNDGRYHCVAAAPPGDPPNYNFLTGFTNGVGVNGMPGQNRFNYIGETPYSPGDNVIPINGIIFEVT